VPRLIIPVAVLCAAAAPFLALQVVQNVGITRKPFKTPYRKYVDEFTPSAAFGFHKWDSSRRPATSLLQRQIYYDKMTIPAVKAHRPDRILPQLWHTRLPAMVIA